MGVPVTSHKTEGPSTSLVFLGIEVNTVTGHLRHPEEKLLRLCTCLQHWGDRKACSRRELESLVGLLNHACKVVRAGRSFLRRMIDLIHAGQAPHQTHVPICLNVGFHSDLAWWQEFITSWNGISFLPPAQSCPTLEMASDASGSWGCGAWYENSWFQIPWTGGSIRRTLYCSQRIDPNSGGGCDMGL